MSLYQCEKCGCVENTACGWYWSRNRPNLTKPEELGKALCSACAPTTYPNGEPTKYHGKWHNIFPRDFYPLGLLITNHEGSVAHKDTGETGKDLHKYRLESEKDV